MKKILSNRIVSRIIFVGAIFLVSIVIIAVLIKLVVFNMLHQEGSWSFAFSLGFLFTIIAALADFSKQDKES